MAKTIKTWIFKVKPGRVDDALGLNHLLLESGLLIEVVVLATIPEDNN